MSLDSIVMPYKENCKLEGEILTKFKIAKAYFYQKIPQKEIALSLSCHKNTINKVISACKNNAESKMWKYLNGDKKITTKELEKIFEFFKYESKKPLGNKRSIQQGSKEELLILQKFVDKKYGAQRMFNHLKREGQDMAMFTICKIKGVYRKYSLKSKRIRTANGERRALYNYDELGVFEEMQYDVKVLADKHSLPQDIYDKFKHFKSLPKYQWTIIDAKTKSRFLAYSYTISSFFGLKFLEYTLHWIRSRGILGKINTQVDMSMKFLSAKIISQYIMCFLSTKYTKK